MNLQDVRKRAESIRRTVDATRERAIGLGMPDHEANKIGADVEESARDCIALLDMIESMIGETRDLSRARELASELHRLLHVPPTFEAIAYPVEVHVGDDFGDPNEPVRSTPVEDDVVRVEADGEQTATPALGGDPALLVAKKRAPETQKPLATWELSGADFRALPFDRAWVESQLPAFRAEQGEACAARPRVVLASWLGKREGAGEHRRESQS